MSHAMAIIKSEREEVSVLKEISICNQTQSWFGLF